MKKSLILLMALVFTMAAVPAKEVIYNKETNIYHDPDCLFARVCTKNCAPMDVMKAIEKEAKPCEKCRTDEENWRDERAYKAMKKAEEERKYLESPGIKKQGNFTFEIKAKNKKH